MNYSAEFEELIEERKKNRIERELFRKEKITEFKELKEMLGSHFVNVSEYQKQKLELLRRKN